MLSNDPARDPVCEDTVFTAASVFPPFSKIIGFFLEAFAALFKKALPSFIPSTYAEITFASGSSEK